MLTHWLVMKCLKGSRGGRRSDLQQVYILTDLCLFIYFFSFGLWFRVCQNAIYASVFDFQVNY